MKYGNAIRRLSLIVLTVFVTGLWSAGSFAGQGQNSSKVPVLSIINGFAQVGGASSKVTRTDSGVSMLIRTRDLTPGDAYTLWMVVFNFPMYCAQPYACADPDFENPNVAGDVMYVAGNIVGGSGRGAFAGHKAIGDNSGSVFPPLFPPDVEPPGLLNPTGAEIHLLMHSHVQKIVEFMPEMIHTFGGGCVDPGPPFSGLWFPEWGPQGPNACVTEQVAIHASPDTP